MRSSLSVVDKKKMDICIYDLKVRGMDNMVIIAILKIITRKIVIEVTKAPHSAAYIG